MSTSPMPRALAVVRALMYVKGILTLLLTVLMLIGIAVMTEDEVLMEMGSGKGAAAVFMIPFTALTLFELYVAVTLRRGGRLRQWFVRAVAGLGLVFGLFSLLVGEGSLPDTALAALLLVLNESRSARNWYRSGAPTGAGAQPPAAEGSASEDRVGERRAGQARALDGPAAEGTVAEGPETEAPRAPTP